MKKLVVVLGAAGLCSAVLTASAAAPVAEPRYAVLPLGAVRPEGWLKVQLEQQAAGLTGHAEELYDDIGNSYWKTGRRLGDEFGGKFDDKYSWERGPYYAKGLVSLALVLGDAGLTAKAKRWIDSILASQRENGDFGPKNDNWWANMIALHLVRDWGEATGDARVVPFLTRYFAYQLRRLPKHPLAHDSFWAQARGGDNLEAVLWLYGRTKSEELVKLAKLLVEQSSDWTSFYLTGGSCGGEAGFRAHAVNFMQGLKFPVHKWRLTGDARDRNAPLAAFAPDGWPITQHGRADRQLNGTEPLSGRSVSEGAELCSIAEHILSCRDIVSVTGEMAAADDLEFTAYNALPCGLGDDGKGIHYYTLLDQPFSQQGRSTSFSCNSDGNSITPGPDSGYGCCRSNFHFAWPKFVQSMWMEAEGGLTAVAYGPCVVSNELAVIEESGDYPFGDRVSFRILETTRREWTLSFRRPGWCRKMTVALNGKEIGEDQLPLRRVWRARDRVSLVFASDIVAERGRNETVALRRGPLVYALAIPAEIKALATPTNRTGFPVREYSPKAPWNYALKLGAGAATADVTYCPPNARDLSGNVFGHGRVTSALKVKAAITDFGCWGQMKANYPGEVMEPPVSPLVRTRCADTEEELTLVPLGASQIRITLFPWYSGAKADHK